MRTVTFSEPQVKKMLNEQFVCTTENIKGQRNAGTSFDHRPNDPPGTCLRSNGKQNVQIYFLTPQGEIYHVVTGYISGPELVEELKFALTVHDKLKAEASDDQRRETLVGLHREALKSMDFTDEQINGKGFAAFFDPVQAQNQLRNLAQNPAGGFGQAVQQLSRREILSDHKFCMERPLLSHKEFKPEELVGSGTSFFGSTSFGSQR